MSYNPHSSPHVIDVGMADFAEKVIEASRRVPVVVDFWAEWCGPCRSLGPVLEKLAAEYGGRFILAKVDSDRNQELAAQFRVRGIPAVKAVVNGQVVSEFTGAQPEAQVRRFIEALLPSPAEPLYRQAQEAIVAGDNARALELLAHTLAMDPKHEMALLDRAELYLEMGQATEAGEALAAIGAVEDKERLASLRARLELASAAAGVQGDVAELEARVAADPADLEARLELANLLATRHRLEPAMAHLLEIVRRDRTFGDDAGRKGLLKLFEVMGSADPLVRQYRRLLASALNV